MHQKRFQRLGAVALSLATLLLGGRPFAWAQQQSTTFEVVHASKQALAPPLESVVPLSTQLAENGSLSEESNGGQETGTDGAQDLLPESSFSVTALATKPGLNFLGLGTGLNGFVDESGVPDTNGAVGSAQFVQWVNFSFAVFNKSDGRLLFGPADGNTFWQALGGPCAANNNLDPIAQFDKLARRWVMMMPVFKSPFNLCVAVSHTSDAVSGGWNLYSFAIPGRFDPDYPKLGVWPDAYYVTYNRMGTGGFLGAAACALDRNKMLNGGSATMQCFSTINPAFGSLLPGDLDGNTPPPANSPNYFVNFDGNGQSLDLWKFHVDFTTPSNSTFTGPTKISVPPFTEGCGGGICIPQAGTNQLLNSYGDRIMYRLPYRNFGSHASLLVNHTVNTGTSSHNTGIRWYELRNTGGGFGLFQHGTYAPDSSYRWMGSIAMDKAGDIALGYSASSSALSPSIRYTGRVPGDPAGQMEGEADVLTSAGVPHSSQVNSALWGDYSSMAIDSIDDCTFWYTTEYQATRGARWSTRIASFSFPSCPTTWAVVNKASTTSSSSTNLSIPSTGTGHLLAVALMFNASTSVTGISDNAGNTYVSAGARSSVGPLSVEIWYAVNSNPGASILTPRFAQPASHVEITEWEVSGISSSRPDATAVATGNVVSNTAGPPVRTTHVGDFVVSVMFASGAAFSGTSSGNEFEDDFATFGNGWAHIISAASGATTHQASWFSASPSGKYCASTVAFLPSS